MTAPETKPFHIGDHDEDFQLLRGKRQFVRGLHPWDDDQVLEKYTASTDHIVGVLDGSIHERALLDPIDPELSAERPDTVVWLDKSARPVSWFVDSMWEQFAQPDAVKPDDEFLNIDRVNWFVKQGHPVEVAERRLTADDFDIEKVPAESIARIRALFVTGELDETNWQDEVWKLPTRLDGKNILIVDEVRNKGGTLAIALQLIKRAVPESTVSGEYFWKPGRYSINKTSTEVDYMQIDSVPLWYSKDNSYGRGIGEISIDYYTEQYRRDKSQENLRRMIGAFVLSAPHHDPETYETKEDILAKKLEQDIAYLSYDVAANRILRVPNPNREVDDFKAILAKQGLDIPSFRDLRTEREAARSK